MSNAILCFLSVFVCPCADGGLYTWIIAKCRLSCRYHLSCHFVKRCFPCLQTYFSCLQRVFLMLSNLLEQYWSFWPPPSPPKIFYFYLYSTMLESNKKVHTRSVVWYSTWFSWLSWPHDIFMRPMISHVDFWTMFYVWSFSPIVTCNTTCWWNFS